MQDTKHVKDEKMNSTLDEAANDDYSVPYEIREILREAGDRAWAVLGRDNELWCLIDEAGTSSFSFECLGFIDMTIENLEKVWKESLSSDDYDFIYQRLITCKEKLSSED